MDVQVPVTERVERTVKHYEPVMETVEEEYTEEVDTGEVRLGLRYSECAVFEAAYQRSLVMTLEARVEAVEARLAA